MRRWVSDRMATRVILLHRNRYEKSREEPTGGEKGGASQEQEGWGLHLMSMLHAIKNKRPGREPVKEPCQCDQARIRMKYNTVERFSKSVQKPSLHKEDNIVTV